MSLSSLFPFLTLITSPQQHANMARMQEDMQLQEREALGKMMAAVVGVGTLW